MKTVIFLIIGCLSLFSLYGQTLEREVVSNGGDNFQHAGISMDWTLGETVTQTLGNSPILTQGFQQPDFDSKLVDSPANYWMWADYENDLGGGGFRSGTGNVICISNEGDIVLVGSKVGNASTGYDIFLSKIRPDGNVIWSKSISTQPSDDFGEDVAVDDLGNIYIVGSFDYYLTIEGATYYANGSNDIVFIKYNTNGELQWVKQLGASNNGRGKGIALDNGGNIFLTGDFVGTISLGSHSITSTFNYWSIFVAKFDTDGNIQWLHNANSFGDNTRANKIKVDNNGNSYLTGIFQGNILFDDSTEVTGNDTFDVLLAKYDSTGNLLWAKSIASSSAQIYENKLTIDNANNLYLTGNFSMITTFENIISIDANGRNLYLTKYNQDGNQVWLRTIEGGNNYTNGITTDQFGNPFITGDYHKTHNGPPNERDTNVFIAKYNPNGNLEWFEETEGFIYQKTANAIAVDTFGNSYITGSFNAPFYFSDSVSLASGKGIYFAKYGNTPYVPTSNARITSLESLNEEISNNTIENLKLYPNPVSDGKLLISLDNYEGALNYTITNALGQEVQRGIFKQFNQSESFSIAKLSAGLYIIKTQTKLGEKSQKFIIDR